MDMVKVPKRIVDLLMQVQKDGVIQRASELQEVYRLLAAHSAGAQTQDRPVVVLAYNTKGHNKPCGQTMGANGYGEFVTVYYGDIDAAERAARDHIKGLGESGHRFNWALVMRSDEEAYRGPAMTFARADRAKGE